MSNQELYEAAFDQWMYDYANNPEAYESMERAALSHLLARDKGEPTYGQRAAATFCMYLDAIKAT